MIKDTRPFPIQQDRMKAGSTDESHGQVYLPSCEILWWLAEIAYKEYNRRYPGAQTLEEMADRGGMGRWELLDWLRQCPDGQSYKMETGEPR